MQRHRREMMLHERERATSGGKARFVDDAGQDRPQDGAKVACPDGACADLGAAAGLNGREG